MFNIRLTEYKHNIPLIVGFYFTNKTKVKKNCFVYYLFYAFYFIRKLKLFIYIIFLLARLH